MPAHCQHDVETSEVGGAHRQPRQRVEAPYRQVGDELAPSVGSVGDAYDSALAESEIGLFKTELIHRRGPWRNVDDVEIATLEWVDWHNNRRLHTGCADLTPAELEDVYYREHPALPEALLPTS
jgi:putative transposase